MPKRISSPHDDRLLQATLFLGVFGRFVSKHPFPESDSTEAKTWAEGLATAISDAIREWRRIGRE